MKICRRLKWMVPNSNYFQVSVNGPDTLTGDTCLVAAAHSGQRGCCNILLRRGAKTSVTNLTDLPPLHAAVSGGHWGITEMLLKEGANLEQKDGLGRTPVIVSAAEGHSAVIEHLLSKKASIGKFYVSLFISERSSDLRTIWMKIFVTLWVVLELLQA